MDIQETWSHIAGLHAVVAFLAQAVEKASKLPSGGCGFMYSSERSLHTHYHWFTLAWYSKRITYAVVRESSISPPGVLAEDTLLLWGCY